MTVWIMDSGASMTIMNDMSDFWDYREYRVPIVFKTAGSATIKALGEGTIKGVCLVNGKHVSTTITNIAYIPQASGRLFSTGCIERTNYCLIQGSGKMVIYDQSFEHGRKTQNIGKAIVQADYLSVDNLYLLYLEILDRKSVRTVSSDWKLWH